jgi:hypothetical protein
LSELSNKEVAQTGTIKGIQSQNDKKEATCKAAGRCKAENDFDTMVCLGLRMPGSQ